MKKLFLVSSASFFIFIISIALYVSPAANAGGVYQFKFGNEGCGDDGQFHNPVGVAVDGSGNIYVADQVNHRIQVFNSGGVFQFKFGTPGRGDGTGDGQFNSPEGVAVDGSGKIYVADQANHRIQVFDSGGVFQLKFGTTGSGDGQFNSPYGVAVDGSGNIYVADTHNHRIQVFSGIQGNTPPGSNIIIQPVDTTTGTTPVTLTFADISQGGNTTLSTGTSGPEPPSNFQLGDPATYYEIKTTAGFTGMVEMCIDYTGQSFPNEDMLKLFHFEDVQWVDITTTLDTTNNIICGSATSLSPFAVFQELFQFGGLFPPVDNPPTVNVLKAGSGVPVKFSLNGNQGLNIFETGFPKSQAITCDSTSPLDVLEETVSAGSEGLIYDSGAGQYIYVWKTDKSWAGSCRQLVLNLIDGTSHIAKFKFKK